MTPTALVTGGRGKTGNEVVRQLARQRGIEVRAGSRRPAQLGVDGAARPVLFDWLDRGTWPDAVAGVDAIYLMRPDLEHAEKLVAELVTLLPGSHVVLLSEQSAERTPPDAWVARVERAVTEHAERWTILRPSWFHQGLTDQRLFLDQIRVSRNISMPSAGAPIAWVDARDIASVAVTAILNPDDHDRRHHTLTGPTGLTLPEVAALLSTVSGRAVTAVDQPLTEALSGVQGWIADVLEGLYLRVQHGRFGDVTDTVESIVGVAPRPLEDFMHENRSEWQRGGPVQGGV